jgi:hypothetical protein
MSDTPRTDAHNWHDGDYDDPLHAFYDFACQLERELNAANQRIKRLEEALEGTVKWIVDLADSGDAGFWNPEEQSVIIAARAALQAKEAKL